MRGREELRHLAGCCSTSEADIKSYGETEKMLSPQFLTHSPKVMELPELTLEANSRTAVTGLVVNLGGYKVKEKNFQEGSLQRLIVSPRAHLFGWQIVAICAPYNCTRSHHDCDLINCATLPVISFFFSSCNDLT